MAEVKSYLQELYNRGIVKEGDKTHLKWNLPKYTPHQNTNEFSGTLATKNGQIQIQWHKTGETMPPSKIAHSLSERRVSSTVSPPAPSSTGSQTSLRLARH